MDTSERRRYQVIERNVVVRNLARVQGETLKLSDEEASQLGNKVRPCDGYSLPEPTTYNDSTSSRKYERSGNSQFDAWGNLNSGGWLGRGPDSEVRADSRKSRDRAFDVSLDDRFAKRVVETLTNNVIGKGMKLQAKVQKVRGDGLDDRKNRLIEEAWEEWLDRRLCHTAGLQDFQELQKTIFSSCVIGGESFVRFIRRVPENGKIPLQLETIEAAQMPVEEYRRAESGRQIRMGVEVNDWLRPVGYWFYSWHPGEYWSGYMGRNQGYQRFPAEDILHLYALRRLNQHRGMSWLRATQEPLKHLAGFNEAYLYAARVGACVAGILQSAYPDQMPLDDQEEAASQDGLRPIGKIEPGTFYKLPQGDTFQGFDPKRPETAYEPFIRAQLRGIAAGTNITYEELSNDYSQANYSSIRQSHVISIYYWQVLQDWFCRKFLDPIFAEFMQALYFAYPSDFGDFPDFPNRYLSSKSKRWAKRGWAWVDPLKEVSAIEKSLKMGLTSLSEEADKKGGDFEETIRNRAREVKMIQDIAAQEGIPIEYLMDTNNLDMNNETSNLD